MGDRIKSWLIVIGSWIAGITIALLVFFGPKDAAGFAGWVVDSGKHLATSGKIFIEEMKKHF